MDINLYKRDMETCKQYLKRILNADYFIEDSLCEYIVKQMSKFERFIGGEYYFKYIPNPSYEVQLAAVKENAYAIKYIENPSYEIKLEAVKKCGWAIEYIKNPSYELQLEAVKQDGSSLEYIPNPSYEVQLEAVRKNGYAIRYIKNQTAELQLEATKKYKPSICYIENPTDEAKSIAFSDLFTIKEYVRRNELTYRPIDLRLKLLRK